MKSKFALVIRHIDFEGMGVLSDVLVNASYEWRYHDIWREALTVEAIEEPALVVSLGGPFSVRDKINFSDLQDEMGILRARLAIKLPIVGICLGAQMIASALGARIYELERKEIGWAPVSLTEAGRESCLRHLIDVPVLHWHGEGFDLPENATRLASSQLTVNQAFEIGRHVLGFQFHPEVDAEPGIDAWITGHGSELQSEDIDPQDLRDQTKKVGQATKKKVQLMMSEWLARLPSHESF